MKKFNNLMYKEIMKNGFFEDNYYKYIIIDKNKVFKGWKTSYLSSMKYEFFGILDKSKKDIFTLDNIEEIQKDFIKEAEEKILQNIIEKENDYIKIQQKNFNKRIENDDFKRGILYYYIDGYSSNNFNALFVKNKTPEDFKKELLKGLITTKKVFTDEAFFTKYAEETKEAIIKDFIEYFTNDNIIDKWGFNYDWNNNTKYTEKEEIEATFKNSVSLKLNKYNLIVNEYKKIYDTPSEQLKKSKKLYNLTKDFEETNKNKTCKITFDSGFSLKVLDFSHLIYLFGTGNTDLTCYRLFTNADLNKLKEHNEQKGRGKYETDLFIEDITQIEFSKSVIYEEKYVIYEEKEE